MLHFLQTRFLASRGVGAELGQIPVFADPNLSVLKLQQMSGGQLLDLSERGQRSENVSKIEILEQCLIVDRCEFRGDSQNRFDLRPEQQPAARKRIMQGLLP